LRRLIKRRTGMLAITETIPRDRPTALRLFLKATGQQTLRLPATGQKA